jgi:hypothetical protein
MDDGTLIQRLQDSGAMAAMDVERWRDSAKLLAALDVIGQDGASALIKIDGARPDGSIYTVVVSGGRMGEAFFRKDGRELPPLLREAISFYLDRADSDGSVTHGGGG